jgi:hypothetical protein
MKLPNGDHALVDERKLREYLLSPDHPIGRSKAAFFPGLGFDPQEWRALESALLQLAGTASSEPAGGSAFGQKYRTRGRLESPSGRAAEVLVVWVVRAGEDIPRFVTAYPG